MNKLKNNELNLPQPKPKQTKKRGGANVMSLKMAGKWARLAREIVEKQTTSLNCRIRWVNFARRLLKNEREQNQFTPLERWQVVLSKVLHRVRT